MVSAPATVYHPRSPQSSDYYRCVEDHLETFIQVYEDRFERRYGFWRPYLQKVITRYLECGDLHHGFARVKCRDCHHEYLLAFSCKRRHFCPSCHQKRVVEFGEWLCSHVLKKVPHRHFVFSLPKILRRYFLYDRDLLSVLIRCAWESLKLFLRTVVPERNPIPGAVIAIQTFGDFLGFNPHCHVLVMDGGFYGRGMFRVAPPLDLKKLEAIFRHKVFKMLLAIGRITQDLIVLLSNWRHSGFQVFCGERIFPQDETAMENLARYIIRASFSQERMQYLPGPSKVVYRAKDGSEEKVFDPLEWLAAMCSHIPDRGEQRVRYYGYYSPALRGISRGKRKETEDDGVPCILEADKSSKEYRKNWGQLIQKIYEVDPLTCPKACPEPVEGCRGIMRIISFIEDPEVIKAILKHLGLWLVRSKPTPMAHAPPSLKQIGSGQAEYVLDHFSQIPMNDDHLHRDPEYPGKAYLQS